ncbi:hypothetical protein J5X86_09990 [Streptomyces sp. NEAU-YJ-81]|nr:hypothetical protein [Streptomyces sp. NEAU-YJ-81]
MRCGPLSGERVRSEAENTQDVLRGVGDPLTDRDERAGTGQHRRSRNGYDVVVHVEHGVTVVDRRRTHQEVKSARRAMLSALRELVLRRVHPAPGILRETR